MFSSLCFVNSSRRLFMYAWVGTRYTLRLLISHTSDTVCNALFAFPLFSPSHPHSHTEFHKVCLIHVIFLKASSMPVAVSFYCSAGMRGKSVRYSERISGARNVRIPLWFLPRGKMANPTTPSSSLVSFKEMFKSKMLYDGFITNK